MKPLILLVAVSKLAPLDLMKYYLAVKEDLIDPDCLIKLTSKLSSGSQHAIPIANLKPDLNKVRPLKRRWYSWCESAPKRHQLKKWMASYLIQHDPNSLFNNWMNFLEQKLQEEIDPWKTTDWLYQLPLTLVNSSTASGFSGFRTVKLPIVEKLDEADENIGDTVKFEDVMGRKERIDACRSVRLKEEAILALSQAHLILMIGGPKNSGKSSLAASLAIRMSDILSDLNSRMVTGLPVIKLFSADTATPVSDLINPEGRLAEEVTSQRKRLWTSELVIETVSALIRERQQANLIIADLPGKIDGITKSLVSTADAGCVISRNWQDHVVEISDTRRMFQQAGLPILVEASSRSFEEGYPSVLKHYTSTNDRHLGFISGRVVGLNRADWSWDPFVYWMAELLLFELLPGLLARQKKQLEPYRV